MRTVRLYGHLRRFGREFTLDVRTPAEALRALLVQIPGLRAHLAAHSAPGYRVWVGEDVRDPRGLLQPCGTREVIRIVPVVAGAGRGKGLIGVVLGIGLIALSSSGGFAALLIDTVGTGAITGSVMAATGSIGWAMVLGGISSVLFAPPKAPTPESRTPTENQPSYAFNGAVNTGAQGNPVPLLYGRLRVGSQVISSGLFTQQIAA